MSTAVIRDLSVFGEAIAYFNEAASLLDLTPGMRAILTHPSRQMIFSLPFQRDNGELEVYTGYRVQYNFARGPGQRAASGIIRASRSTRSRRLHFG